MMGAAIPARSKFFDFAMDGIAYKEGKEQDDAEPCEVHAGHVAFADVNEEVRKLGHREVPVVRFTLDLREGVFWMPSARFYRVAKEKDPSKQTSSPFHP
ncbi:MAG TPA: hypothetical protein VKR60_01650 [Candidatus Sulfotelmatobacter sp.]|nr:hypothetical protein [Candidatus Sulfotelmatobacter sp.]